MPIGQVDESRIGQTTEHRQQIALPPRIPPPVPPCVFTSESYSRGGESRRSLAGQSQRREVTFGMWLGGSDTRFEPRLSFSFLLPVLPPTTRRKMERAMGILPRFTWRTLPRITSGPPDRKSTRL